MIKFYLSKFSLLFSVGGGLIEHAPVLNLLHLHEAYVDELSGQIYFQNA